MKASRLSDKSHAAYHWSQFAKVRKAGGRKQNPPFVDIPVRGTGARRGRATGYYRMSPKSGSWDHPGFKPKGSGGPGPMRPDVEEHIRKTVQDTFHKIFQKVWKY